MCKSQSDSKQIFPTRQDLNRLSQSNKKGNEITELIHLVIHQPQLPRSTTFFRLSLIQLLVWEIYDLFDQNLERKITVNLCSLN